MEWGIDVEKPVNGTGVREIKHMVERFLSWRLPDNFNPDGGISFQPVVNLGTEHQHRLQPTGTNLFDYRQAEEMVRHMVDGMEAALKPEVDVEGVALNNICEMMQKHVDNWPNPKKLSTAIALIDKTLMAAREAMEN